jgi:single-stranded-DNA-specific exonuclease
LVLANPSWSHGVVGLVASRVAEHFGKPTIILQVEDELAKGSARSVGKFSIIEALQAHAGLFERFGGHAAAAGMTLQTKNINVLRTELNRAIDADQIELMQRELAADCWLQAEYVSNEGLDQLAAVEPTGQANPRVIFYSEAKINSLRYVGRQNQHAQLTFLVDGQQMRAIAFDAAAKWPFLKEGEMVAFMVGLREDNWQGMRRPKLEVIAARKEVQA